MSLLHRKSGLSFDEKLAQSSALINKPAYLHALTDLREARWLISHRPGDAAVSGDQDVAVTRIDETINEIKHAAIDDGKDFNDHPGVDEHLDHRGRLNRANKLLGKVHSDIAREEDGPMTRGLRDRATQHSDEVMEATRAPFIILKSVPKRLQGQ